METRAQLEELIERAMLCIAELEAQCRNAGDHDIIPVSGAAMVQVVDMMTGLRTALAALLPEEREGVCGCDTDAEHCFAEQDDDGDWYWCKVTDSNHSRYEDPDWSSDPTYELVCPWCLWFLSADGIARRHRDPDATRIDLLQALLMGGCGEEFVSGNEAARRLEPLLWPSTEGSVQLWHGDLRAALDAAGKEAGDDGEEIV